MEDLEQDTKAGADNSSLHVACIASSADGLEALLLLVKNLPRTDNTIYVIAQQISPSQKSDLTSLIAREATLPVVELDGETDPVPGTIYIAPPDNDVAFEGSKLRLRDPAEHPASAKPFADPLFKSIAEECGERCVSIVLAGTGSDDS